MSGSRTSIWKLRKEDIVLGVKEMGLTVPADIFSRCMLVLGPEPGQEGRLWATGRCRLPVDGAAIASDVRE
ncbi:hypothetical protein AVEN_151214-1 [Araneus ventricosus]|uniref:Uncharacterized protein n=1 Tax=Araneus ventricosus TaxID=182803 RepID=A0A4Y2VZD4_ARAVE|nr:hypothetical protein AVEN_151214-1 [Araneus ventricosus]